MYGFARNALFAVLLTGAAGPALAADLYEEPIPFVPEVVGGWYIRGHIGMSNQFFDGLESDLFDVPDDHGWCQHIGHEHHWERHPCPVLRLASLVQAMARKKN